MYGTEDGIEYVSKSKRKMQKIDFILYVCDAWKIECRLQTIAYRVHWTSQQMFSEFHVLILIDSVIAVCVCVRSRLSPWRDK